jgi:DNA-binding XRE family transcriptional regulator
MAYISVMTPEQEFDALKSWPDDKVCELIASRVRQLRRDGGYTQESLAALANVPLRTFKRFEVDGSADLPPSAVPFITRKSGVARLIDLDLGGC